MNGIKAVQTLTSVLAVLVLTMTNPAHSGECNSLAPLADPDNAENGYFDLSGNPIDSNTSHQIDKIAKFLRGEWVGTQMVKSCKGHFKSPEPEIHTFQVKADITQHHTGAVRLEAEKESKTERVVKLETYFVTPQIDTSRGFEQDWHTIDVPDENTIIFSEKSRTLNANGFTRLIHQVRKLQLQDSNTVTLDTKLYVNSFLVEQTGWTLRRRIELQ